MVLDLLADVAVFVGCGYPAQFFGSLIGFELVEAAVVAFEHIAEVSSKRHRAENGDLTDGMGVVGHSVDLVGQLGVVAYAVVCGE